MPFVALHVLTGTITIVAGFIALYSVKGRRLHRKSGMVFVCTMLVMALSGTVVAFEHPGAALNVPARLVAAYLVVTDSPRSGLFPPIRAVSTASE